MSVEQRCVCCGWSIVVVLTATSAATGQGAFVGMVLMCVVAVLNGECCAAVRLLRLVDRCGADGGMYDDDRVRLWAWCWCVCVCVLLLC